MRYLMPLALALALSACAAVPAELPAPARAAGKTVIDEKAAILAETAYAGASRLGAVAARSGLINKDRFKALDARAFAALGVVRSAYNAGNASDFGVAVIELNATLAQITALTSGV